jgi:hypothetical protein
MPFYFNTKTSEMLRYLLKQRGILFIKVWLDTPRLLMTYDVLNNLKRMYNNLTMKILNYSQNI